MTYTDFIEKQINRSDFLGQFASQAVISPELVNYDNLEDQLNFILDQYPDDSIYTITVLISWLEFCHDRYNSLRDERALNSRLVRDIRGVASQALKYLDIFWNEFFSVYENPAEAERVAGQHDDFRNWLMMIQELEIEYRFEERKRGIYL